MFLLSICASEARDSYERAILDKILNRAYYVVSVKVELESEGFTSKSVLDLAKESENYETYISVVKGLGYALSEDESPSLREPDKFKKAMGFLVSFAPFQLGTLAEMTEVFSDINDYRKFTVMYLIRCFYLEALIRNSVSESDGTQIFEAASNDVRDPGDDEKWKYREDGLEKNWLNVDVFRNFLEDDLLQMLNAKRGRDCLAGADLLPCCVDRKSAGEVKGDQKEFEELKHQFTKLTKTFTKGLEGSTSDSRATGDVRAGAGGAPPVRNEIRDRGGKEGAYKSDSEY